jgi:phospholipid/cholesterol/gamma-HCH transport system substrate-binding protein
MENRAHALLAGLFTVLLLLASALALWWLSGTRELTHTYLLETRGNVTDLNPEAQVRYRGIRAGKVIGIHADHQDPGLLLVEIALSQKYPLTDQTRAKLNYQGITGLAYVMLEEPAGNTPGKRLDTAGPKPPRLALQPGLLDTLGNQADDIAGQVATLTLRLNRLLDDRNLGNLAQTLDNLAAASSGLKELPEVMVALRTALSETNLKRFAATLAHLEQTTGTATPLLQEARQLLGNLTTLSAQVGQLATTANTAGARVHTETLPRAVALMDDMTRSMRRLERVLDLLNDNPQAVLYGRAPHPPGPGEAGFVTSPVPSQE